MKRIERTFPQYSELFTDVADDLDTSLWSEIFKLIEISWLGGGWKLTGKRMSPVKGGRKATEKQILDLFKSEYGERSASQYLTAYGQIVTNDWAPSNPTMVDTTSAEYPQPVVDILGRYIKWGSSQGGTRVYLTRTSAANTWEIAQDPLTALPIPMFNELAEQIKNLQLSGGTEWGIESVVDPATGVTTRSRKPLLAQMNKFWLSALLDDARFRSDTLPETFSNDPEVMASSFFDLSNLESRMKGTPENPKVEAFTDFESQMPSWAVDPWRASFYAIFKDDNRSRQIICLYDTGQTGKSNLFRAITNNVAGGFYCPLSKGSLDNNFGNAKLYGCRLVMFSDTGNLKISQMDKIKQLSGGDPMDIEYKGSNAKIRWTPNCRVMVATNRSQEIDIHAKHQASRMLVFPLTRTRDIAILKKFCALTEDGELLLDRNGEPQSIGAPWDEWMTAQFFDYLYVCRDSYNRLCPNGQDVVMPPEMQDYISSNCVSAATDTLDDLKNNFLEIKQSGRTSYSDMRSLVEYVAGTGKDPDVTYKQVWLLSAGCSRAHMADSDGRSVRCWAGVRFLPHVRVTRDGDIKLSSSEVQVSAPEEIS